MKTLACAAIAAVSLSLCATQWVEAQQVNNSPATGTLEVWVAGNEGDKLPGFLDKFKAANPDLKINVTSIPYDQFDSKLITAISAGTVPDLIRLLSQSAPSLLATNAFAPVPDGLVNKDDFYASVYNSTVRDGVSYAVPWDAYALIFQYRKDLADKAGLSAPKTWDELRAFGKALKAQGVKWPVPLDVGYDIYTAQGVNEIIHQNGGSFISADNTKWTINSDKNVQAVEFWASLFKDGLASPDGPKFLDTVPWFTSGEIASRENGPWFEDWLAEANGKDWVAAHLATAVAPAGPAGSFSALGAGSLAVLKDGKNPDAAWKLVRYLTDPQTQVAWYPVSGDLPAVKAAWGDPTIAGNPLLNAERTALANAVDLPEVPTWNQIGTYLGQQLEQVARGKASAKQVLDDAQKFAENLGMGN